MNQDITDNLQLLLNIDCVSPTDAITINAVCSQVLGNAQYISALSNALSGFFKPNSFNVIAEIAQMAIAIIGLAETCTYTSTITSQQFKYVLFVSIYYYLSVEQPDALRLINMSDFRLAFDNAYSLLIIPVQKIQVMEKTMMDSCMSCLGMSSKIDIGKN